MRIGITCHPTAGGSGVLATELGIAMAERGHEVHFVTEDIPFRLTGYHPNIFTHCVDSVSYPLFRTAPSSLALSAKICEVAEERLFDVWHAHYAIPHAAAALFARTMLPKDRRFSLVTTLHGTDITLIGSDPSFFRVTKYAMEESCAVTAVSQWLAQETQNAFSLTKDVRVIHNFFDERRFSGDHQGPCSLTNTGEKIVMHISNFRPVKRVTDVVRVFKKILEVVNARLIMVGEGPERMAAVGVARQLGIADRIQYLGVYGQIEALIPCADLVIHPSEHESFGLVPLEAMACSVPVIGTASGGITEVVEDGVSGYLCEVGNIDHMATHAIDLLTHPEKAKEMGRKGRERAYAHFGRDAIIDQYEALYEEVRAKHWKDT